MPSKQQRTVSFLPSCCGGGDGGGGGRQTISPRDGSNFGVRRREEEWEGVGGRVG